MEGERERGRAREKEGKRERGREKYGKRDEREERRREERVCVWARE